MKELMQHKWLLYGVCGNMVKLGALISCKTMVVEAIEDPNDGLRSMLKHVQAYREEPPSTTFPKEPIAEVTIREAREDHLKGWEFVDQHQHVWLSLGTCEADDIYPCFQFAWHPKAPNMPHTMPQFDPFDL
jgi:hypothetical protein